MSPSRQPASGRHQARGSAHEAGAGHPRFSDEPARTAQRALEGERRMPGGMIAMLLVVLAFLYLVREILLPFVIAGILAYVSTPFVGRLAARTRWPRWPFALLVLLAITAVGTVIGWFGVPPLLREFIRVAGDLQGSVSGFARVLIGSHSVNLWGESISAAQIGADAANALRTWLAHSGTLITLAAWGFGGFSGVILTWVLLAYFLFDAPRLAAGLFWLVPPGYRPAASRLFRGVDPVLRRYFIGIAVVVAYAATAAYIGLGLFLGLHYALLLAVVSGLLEVVPLVGPLASATLAGLVAVQEATSPWSILSYLVYITAFRLSIDQFFGPLVLGRAARVRPALVIFCFLSGAIVFGVVGVILAVPVALAIRAGLAILYDAPHTEPR